MTDTTIFAGRYRLLNVLPDRDGGQRYRAHDERLGRPVEIRLLDALPGTEQANAALAAASAAARVLDLHVARVFDAGTTADQVYIVSEWIEGTTLAERLASRLPPGREQAIALASDMARGLAAAHATNVIHGGLNPARVRVDNQERAYLTDFGLSATEPWVAPEVADGGPPTTASDVYALGAILHTLVTGRPPDTRADAGQLAPGLSESLRSLIGRSLATNPAYRPLATTLVDELQVILDRAADETRPLGEITGWRLETGDRGNRETGRQGDGEIGKEGSAYVSATVPAPRPMGAKPGEGPKASRRWWLPVALVAVLLIGAVAAFSLWGRNIATPTPTPPVVAGPTVVATAAAFRHQGRVEAIDGNHWTVAGQVIEVPFAVSNNPRPGVQATIDGTIRPDGVWVARSLTWQP